MSTVETRDAAPCWQAAEILRGQDKAVIRLDDKAYVLRLTRAGKLILTK